MRGVAALVAAAVLAAGCSSMYIPRPGRRISAIIKGGQIVYVRDGREFPAGAFGSGIRDAVSGVPPAEAAADEFHDRLVNGLLGLVVSLGCVTVGAVRWTGEAVNEENPDVYDAALAGCFVIGYAVGFHQLITAQPYLYDAINIYNDTVSP
jgi:hypothetical protein